ncbi:MAG TPA: serine/threonine-protein kinase [Ktedonobacteraceae bacterium]
MEVNSITRLGKYDLIRHLAHGGMSDIYLAHKEGAEQLYAIKLVKQGVANNYQHFLRERAILGALKHEHILPILDYCEEEDIAYYVTPYIKQGSLKERFSNGPLSLEEAATILSQLGDALQFMHEHGLVHRDIKPANILLDEANYVWLADFGLAKEINTSSDLTDSSCLLGTPYYIAPELLQEPASNSSDIYALGVVLYEMLTGVPPFTGLTPLAICWKHVYEPVPFPSVLNPSIPEAVEQVILQALAKEPEKRFASVREMVRAYEEALLAPTIVIQSNVRTLNATMPTLLENTLIKAQTRRSQSQQWQRRPLAVAMLMMGLLCSLSVATLAVELQIQPAATVRANAQMVSLSGHRSTTHPVTPQPTATPKPKATQTPQANPTINNSTYSPTDNGDNGSDNPHKQKHHGKHDE